MTDKPLTPPEIARHLGVKADTVRAWITAGELRAFDVAVSKRAGKHRPSWRIRPVDLETFIAKRSTNPPPPKPARSRLPAGVIEFY